MKTIAIVLTGLALLLALAGCKNQSGLSKAPRATFSQIACLDFNGDNRLSADDASDMTKVPDFNADHRRDAKDAAFFTNLNIALDPKRDKSVCGSKSEAPEYLVAHGYFDPADVDCGKGSAVLLVGVGGGVVNLKESGDAAGVRSMIDALQRKYDNRDVQTIGVIAGPAVVGALVLHGGMEDWLTNAVRVYLDRYPCLGVVLVGHSHGAVTTDVVSARLEGKYADRIISVVDVDRVEALYTGDVHSRPVRVDVFNIYETNGPILTGAPYDSPNAENWDASGEQALNDGKMQPVSHTTIDNARSVEKRVVEHVMGRTG